MMLVVVTRKGGQLLQTCRIICIEYFWPHSTAKFSFLVSWRKLLNKLPDVATACGFVETSLTKHL